MAGDGAVQTLSACHDSAGVSVYVCVNAVNACSKGCIGVTRVVMVLRLCFASIVSQLGTEVLCVCVAVDMVAKLD